MNREKIMNIHPIDEMRSGFETAFIDAANDSSLAYRPEFIINSYREGSKVLSALEQELSTCDSFAISVAFITKSGIEPLLQIFKDLEQRGVRGRILTTDYLTFSEPQALKTLAELKNISLRMYQTGDGPGFHTKGYIFHKEGIYRVLIGSSNMTQYALTVNQEWNAKIVSTEQGAFAEKICSEFELLWNSRQSQDFEHFYSEYLTRYEAVKKQQQLVRREKRPSLETYRLAPNSMQVGFIRSLKELLDKDAHKGLLISATGTGKTYASAFGVRDAIKPKGKVLFIVHRKTILRQAKDSYRQVFGSGKKMALLTGEDKDFQAVASADFVFAMITMISKDDVLRRFDPKTFTTIVIDEVHHAAAGSYRKVMDYFQPDFWLGMTATPDRTDEGNIYELFDHNIAYEIRLQQALENDLLCPFHYFGIRDIAFDQDADADQLMKQVEKGDLSVFNMLASDERADYVIRQARYYGWSGDRVKGLIFCSSIREAEVLSDKFNARGLRTLALSGSHSDAERQEAMDRLVSDCREDILDYILTVNIFNEGVDLPDINQVIMLRPTQSAIIFIQQLGRGLRKKEDKEYVVVLDFIGNYANNFLIPIALSGDRTYNKDNMRKYLMEGSNVIPGCSTIHFDEISRRTIFSAIDRATTPLKFLKEKYFNLRDRLGRMPTADEFYRYGEIDPILFMNYKRSSYYRFVRSVDKNCGLEEFTQAQEETLDFICTQIADGKRPHELVLLQLLMEENRLDPDLAAARLRQYNVIMRDEDYDSAIRVLDKSFLNTQGDKKRYQMVSFFEEAGGIDAGRQRRCSSYLKKLAGIKASDRQFREAVMDLIRYGLARYSDLYSDADEDNLVLYQKYSRRDACRILNWTRDDSSTVYGYRIKYGTCPIFVTYEKQEDISETTKYEDRFIDPGVFSWMTRSRVSLNSPESQSIIHAGENGLKMYLFIKKSDGEGTDFYYMGRVHPVGCRETTIADKNGKELPIMNFRLKLAHTVRPDIYDYLTR
ncbi:MAG: DEAD/DEAH box helicase [Eubacterium sp.]|nr:DEAD/DEAH box helicase [Eubacterium sp.]